MQHPNNKRVFKVATNKYQPYSYLPEESYKLLYLKAQDAYQEALRALRRIEGVINLIRTELLVAAFENHLIVKPTDLNLGKV